MRMNKDKRIQVGIDAWHFKAVVTGVTDVIDFAEWLAMERKYDVYFLQEAIKEEDLEDLDILMIISPGYEFDEEEIRNIVKWVHKGGILLVTRPVGKPEIINPLLKNFGAEFTGEEVDSWAFYANVPDEILRRGDTKKLELIRKLLMNSPIKNNLKAIAEGSPKDKKRSYLLNLKDQDWIIIGSATKDNIARAVAAMKKVKEGLVIVLGVIYLFYKWRFWEKHKHLEKEKDSVLTNYNFIKNLLDYIEKESKKRK